MKNLLVITSRYPHEHDQISHTFVYSPVEELKKYFEKIVVISTTPYVPKFLTKWLQPKRGKDSLAKDYKYDNVEVYFTRNIVLPIRLLKELKGWQAYQSTKRILKKIQFEPDIIHAHFSWPCGYVAARLRENLGVPSVLTVHENHDWLMQEEKNKRIIYTWKNVDALIRVNKLDMPILKRYNENTYFIPNGYLPNKFKPMDKGMCRNRLKLPEKKYITFSLGHLLLRKGFHDLIDAIKLVSKEKTYFMSFIGGNGPMRKNLENKIKTLNLKNNVHLVGYIPDRDVPIWMNAADFFILPSYSEGNPTVMFEALGCGKPFIGTTVGGIPEIITDDKLGILVKPGDIDGLSKAICNAMDRNWDTEYILKFAKQFTWENIVNKLLNIYNKITN